MSTSARTPAAGLPGPAWPARPTAAPGSSRPVAVPPFPWPAATSSAVAPSPAAPASPDVAPPAPAAGPRDVTGELPDVPVADDPLDPRTIARASLAAGRNRSLWWTMSGVTAAVAVAYVTDAVVATYVLAAVLVVGAILRAVSGDPGPAAVTVRSRPLDVATLLGAATALAVLASVLPSS